ncbi:hypothetical protein SAMN04488109_3960 [Chryseolinea serpens]|uniref:Uncharacterized protein n=2 Tax=Chryseolinea serpens TaxID=947013 RepID=A0A1M5SJQ0_9BACT|nr:hypothetical protein SAMN04488109_3960 [Chryseolinea serpens]
MEFKVGGTEGAVYNLFDDSSYSVLVEDSVTETGNVSVNGDTLFLLKDVKYNITNNPEVLFLVEDDSICRLELKEKPGPHGVRDLPGDFEVQDIYEYFKKDCEVLKVSR